jgi:hypothetical protein
VLVVEGKWNSNFGGEATHAFKPSHYRVEGRQINPEAILSLAGGDGRTRHHFSAEVQPLTL